jgi:glycosyltransferase involved in cell wall biosynthesis
MRQILVHVVRDPAISGSQRVAFDILSDPLFAGFRRVIVSGDEAEVSQAFVDEAGRAGIERIHLPSLRREVGAQDLQAFADLRRVFRNLRPALVHTHSAKPFVLAGLAAAIEGVPRRVHTLHGISFHRFAPAIARPAYWLLEQFASLLYDRIVSVNEYYRRFFPLARARHRLVVIPNGIAPPREAPAPVADAGAGFPILFAGRLDEQKDPLFVLDVAGSIGRHWKSSRPPHFHVAGSGPLTGRMQAEIPARGLGGMVTMLGWVPDLAAQYARAKAIFLPSKWEACGLVLIEAGAHGCPAVATRVEGVPEVIRDGENGLLFEQGDVEGACRQLARLASDEALRLKLGAQARTDARGRDAATMTGRYRELYRGMGLAS